MTLSQCQFGDLSGNTPGAGAEQQRSAFGRAVLALLLCLSFAGALGAAEPAKAAASGAKKVYIVPIRQDIEPSLVYIVRRGVKEAMEAKADLLVLDMKTHGGRVDVTEEIIDIIGKFPGRTVTYVNNQAFSAGAFISVATQEIYMAPQSVIGAAAPIMLSPTGGGVESLPDTVEAKMNSAIRAQVRVQAEKNGHNIDVIEAMIDKTKELKIDDQVLCAVGSILTLTDREAAKEYGNPPKPLLSLGTVDTMDDLLEKLGYKGAEKVEIEPTGAETLGTWINAIAPILMIIGMVGIYIEFKTPGFGLPGLVGIAAFALYFFGGYVSGLSGGGWMLLFLVGLILIGVELFVLPGHMIAGIGGVILVVVALVMAMVDKYPGGPLLPTFPELQMPLRDFSLAIIISFVMALVLAKYLPQTALFRNLILESPVRAGLAITETEQHSLVGQSGVTLSPLHPGGKARFGEDILDVITEGESVEAGKPVKVIAHTGFNPVVVEVA